MKKIVWVCLLAFGLILSWTVGIAGDFYVIPVKGQYKSWDTKIAGATRFKLVLDGEGVLDRETGLVWQKTIDTTKRSWENACGHCYTLKVANRRGWRLPAVEELATLVDEEVTSGPKVPSGHPFTNPQTDRYWSKSSCMLFADTAWAVSFADGIPVCLIPDKEYYVWCVRGGMDMMIPDSVICGCFN